MGIFRTMRLAATTPSMKAALKTAANCRKSFFQGQDHAFQTSVSFAGVPTLFCSEHPTAEGQAVSVPVYIVAPY